MDKFTKEAICFVLDVLTNDEYEQFHDKIYEELKSEIGEYGLNGLRGFISIFVEDCKEIYTAYLNDEG